MSALPTGVGTDRLIGRPTTPGTFVFTLQADNGGDPPAQKTITFSVNPPVAITTAAVLPTTNQASANAYSLALAATGGTPPYVWTPSAGLPPGINLSLGGVLTGTATASGPFSFTALATDAVGATASRLFALNVNPQLALSAVGAFDATVGKPYSYGVNAGGGTPPYTWSRVAGTIPPGLTLNTSNSVVSGTPTTAGTFTYTLRITDSSFPGDFRDIPISISVFNPIVIANPATLPAATIGRPYSQTLTATGGSPPFLFSLSGGSPPAGINLVGNTLTGTPTAIQTAAFTIDASCCFIVFASKPFTLAVNDVPSVTTSSLPTTTVGATYNQTLTGTSGSIPYTWSVISGALPAGLTLNPSTGAITGAATTAGTFNPTFQLSDLNGATASRPLVIVVNPGLTFTAAAALPRADIGSAYSTALGPSQGTAPYALAVISGQIPAGLVLDTSTGVISGSATQSGAFQFTVKLNDSAGAGIQKTFTLLAYNPPSFITTSLPAGSVGVPYSASVSVRNGVSPFTFTAGTLPPGLHLDSTGNISGTPTTEGSFGFSVTATDSQSIAISTSFSIVIAVPLKISAPSPPPGITGISYLYSFSASGGTIPYKWTVPTGTPPTGLSLNQASGQLSGVPTAPGTFTFTVQVIDAAGATAQASASVDIAAGATITTSSPLTAGIAGLAYSASFAAAGGTAPYTFSLGAGTLPAGLALGASGSLSGTPSESGVFAFGVQVKDQAGSTSTKSFSLTVAPSLKVSPLTLSFKAVSGGLAPAPQNLSAITLSPGIPVSISASGGGSWLTLQQLNSNSPVLTSVAVDPLALDPGRYTASINVSGTGTTPAGQTVAVVFDVDPPPPGRLTADPGSLTFSTVQGGPGGSNPVTISAAGGPARFTASASTDNGGGWLSVSSGGGSLTPAKPVTIGVSVNPAGLAPNTYTGTVVIANTAGGAGTRIGVTLTVSRATRSMILSQSGLTFLAVAGGTSAAGVRSVSVINGGQGVMNWTASPAPARPGQPAPGWLSVTPQAGASDASKAPPAFIVTADPTGLEAGEYYGRVLVESSDAANAPQAVSVVLNVAPGNLGPTVSPSGLLFVAPPGGPDPPRQSVTITNLTQGALSYASSVRTERGNWISYSPASGTLPARGSATLNVQAIVGRLDAAVRLGVITLQFSDGTVLSIDLALILPAAGPASGAASSKAPPAAGGCAPTRLVPIFTSISAGFSVPAAWPTPLEVKVVDDCGIPLGQGSVVSSFSNGDPSLPLRGLRDGSWAGTWVPRGPDKSITVTGNSRNTDATLLGTARATGGLGSLPKPPVVASSGVFNAASLVANAPVAPGSIISIFRNPPVGRPASGPGRSAAHRAGRHSGPDRGSARASAIRQRRPDQRHHPVRHSGQYAAAGGHPPRPDHHCARTGNHRARAAGGIYRRLHWQGPGYCRRHQFPRGECWEPGR